MNKKLVVNLEGAAEGKDETRSKSFNLEKINEREEKMAIKINKEPLIAGRVRLQNSDSPNKLKGLEILQKGGIKLGIPQLRQIKPYYQFGQEISSERNSAPEPRAPVKKN